MRRKLRVRRNSKKDIMIAGTIVLLLCVSIGYAALNSNLNVVGTALIKNAAWDVHFENLAESTGSVKATTPATIEETMKQTITYSVTLTKPGDYYEFLVDVVNKGTLDAMVGENTTISGTGLTTEQKKYLDFTATYENGNPISKGDALKVGDSKRIKVWVGFKDGIKASDIPTDVKELSLTYTLNYVQDDGTSKEVDDKPKNSGATQITELATTDTTNMVADDGTADHNTRYIGANPNNYVKFNNELWRIVGVFNNIKTTASGEGETRIKIVKNGYYNTSVQFDSNNVNDYSTSSLKTELNGTYLNSLTSEAQSQIDDAVWNLGGTANYDSSTNGLASHWYKYERGTTVYSGHATTWTGKVGLFYPSDYGYATSGGSASGRTSCLNKELYNWDSMSNCYNNDYLYDKSYYQWTISPRSGYSVDVFGVNSGGYVGDGSRADNSGAARPAVFLKSKISITSGTGASNDPFILG